MIERIPKRPIYGLIKRLRDSLSEMIGGVRPKPFPCSLNRSATQPNICQQDLLIFLQKFIKKADRSFDNVFVMVNDVENGV